MVTKMSSTQRQVLHGGGEGHVTATQAVLPATSLRPYIRAYRLFDLDAVHSYTVPAWTRTNMLLAYGEGSCAVICGPHSRPERYGGGVGRLRFAAVEFRSLVMAAIVRDDLSWFADAHTNAADVLDGEQIDAALEALAEAPDLWSRRRILDGYFTQLLAGIHVSTDPAIREALTAMHAHRGPVSLAHLTALTGMAERTLRRRLAAVTGLAPTRYGRVLRGERTLACLYYRPELSLADLVRRLGYSDQSHLVHELRSLASTTPGQLRRQTVDGITPLRDYFRLDAV
jgi:AraC-like DNA-binding protein